jgi:hypothetical protein
VKLKIAEDLSLPVDVVTQTVAILAKRRAGKSYTMRRLVEQLAHAGQQVVLVDPKGDQWGVRSAADGKAPGLPIVILGGERADVPLEAGAGEVVAKLVVEERVSALLDLSLFRKHEVATFMTGFLEALYRLKAREQFRTPLMLVIDEADAIAPQKPQKGEERMLGAAEDIVRRGGQRGIGCVLVTQRSAVLNKNVLTQAQILVVLRTIAPQDLLAMKAWVDVHGTDEEGAELMDSLPSLPVGDAWFWSPGWPTVDGIFKRVHVLPIETFDSGATPKPGESRKEPKAVADVDLEALKRQMSATIEKAKADDPRELRKQIAELKRQVESGLNSPRIHSEPKVVEKFVLKDGQLARAEKLVAQLDTVADRFSTFENDLRVTAKEIRDAIRQTHNPTTTATTARPSPHARREAPALPQASGSRPARVVPPSNGNGNLGKAERAILAVLAQHPEGCQSGKLTLLTGYRYSGSFKNSLSALPTAGYIEGQNTGIMRITDGGAAALGAFDPLPSGAALGEFWLSHPSFGKAERLILEQLLAHPDGLSAADLCSLTNYEYSGSFKNSLSALRTAGVIVGKNTEVMRASDELFD